MASEVCCCSLLNSGRQVGGRSLTPDRLRLHSLEPSSEVRVKSEIYSCHGPLSHRRPSTFRDSVSGYRFGEGLRTGCFRDTLLFTNYKIRRYPIKYCIVIFYLSGGVVVYFRYDLDHLILNLLTSPRFMSSKREKDSLLRWLGNGLLD